ncbi:uncharacterized protein spn-F isoform X3 [Palaemon carinicauda]|uniref:uncharacterized protein spn-F isoform X3 n=1 Tax=Palaemon carinicauda TaxID=392227 RepID=UPI0035B5A8BA
MAEPVEDDVSFLGIQEGAECMSPRPDCQVPSTEYCGAKPEYRTSEYRAAGALRAPIISSPSRQERTGSTGRAVPSGSGDKTSPFSSSSPVASPRTPDRSPNYNIDASGSTFALQVALRNMKERYHKLQKKMALIEDDNQRLISGKSELFGEIGKLQENSIKLREKNLQLNQEIHTKHQECCSLKEKFSALSTENMNLTRQLAKTVQENRRLNKQVNLTAEENKRLREKLSLISAQVKTLPGGASLAASASELSTPLKTKIVPLSEELDSFNDPPTRFLPSHKDALDDYEQISSSELGELDSLDDEASNEEHLLMSVQSATRRMKDLIANLQEQNHSLQLLSPFLHSLQSSVGSHTDESHRNTSTISRDGTLGQRDRDMSTVTLTPSTEGYDIATEEVDDDGNCQSRLATCGSVLSPTYISAGALNTPVANESVGDNNIHIEADLNEDGRPRSPFDWRQVQVSDDEGRDNDTSRPDVRTVSTSPVPGLDVEEDRICPMCNACFPRVIPQESFESHVVSHFEVENGFEVIA